MSGSGYLGKSTNLPDDIRGAVAQAERESQWGPIDGKVTAYDHEKGTVDVQPLYKPRHNGKNIDMPELKKVPMRFPRSGSGAITHPIPVGTRVRLTPQMRSGENYHTEDDGSASDTRSFSLSDMEATLDGGDSLTDPLQNVDTENTHVRADPEGQYGIRLNKTGKIAIEGNQGNIYDLVQEAVDLCSEGFELLGTEPTLVHMAEYAAIGAQLDAIASKLAAMSL